MSACIKASQDGVVINTGIADPPGPAPPKSHDTN
jgi:hypothetical protein